MTRVLYFTAAWCAPCRRFGPMLATAAEALRLNVERVDLDEDPGRALAYDVQSVPTVVLVRDGETVDRFGAIGPSALRDRLEDACGR